MERHRVTRLDLHLPYLSAKFPLLCPRRILHYLPDTSSLHGGCTRPTPSRRSDTVVLHAVTRVELQIRIGPGYWRQN